ncbi:MAG: SurA N-terminal domain-containing protein, partial [Bacillota bacterium]|nr:SurA N-terminal domain-containing protein [Bacillota bacterium]
MKNLNRRLLFLLVAVMALSLLVVGCGDKSVADVNGVKISQEDFDKRVNDYKRSLELQGYGDFLTGEEGEEFLAQLQSDALEELITYQVLYQEAEKLNILPDKSEAKERIENDKAQFPDGEFQTFLSEYNWTEKDLEEYYYEQLVEMAIYNHLTKDIVATDDDIAKFYDEHKNELVMVRASHILVETEEEAVELIA